MKFRRELQLEQDDLVIFGEDGKFHLVQKETYTANELPASLMSTAEFLVGLGAVVADVTAFYWEILWRKLTTHCSCIVLNLSAIRQLSEKKGKPLTLTHEADGRQPKDGRKPEHLMGKEASHAAPADGKRGKSPELGQNDLVIFNEDRKFYWVKSDDYVSQSSDLPEEMRSAPELMVMLGVVAADIPRIPTAGTACFLLNLASLRRGSTYAARILAENIQVSRQPEQEKLQLLAKLAGERAAAATALKRKTIADALRLKKWADDACKGEKEQPPPSARSTRPTLSTSPRDERVPPARPIEGRRELRAASGRSKRAPGKRAPTARRPPRGGKK